MNNTILITMDSLRADHCGFMGYDEPTTPAMDHLAESGTVFTNAIAPGPSTPESMPSVFSGEYLSPVTGTYDSMLEQRRDQITTHLNAHLTLPERLSMLGYETIGISPNPYTSRYFGFDELFDEYVDFMSGSREGLYERLFTQTSLPLLPIRTIINWIQREEVFRPWETFFDTIATAIESASQPYFIWVLLMDPHLPYLVPADYRSQSKLQMYKSNFQTWWMEQYFPVDDAVLNNLITSYDDAIRYADAFIDTLIDHTSEKTSIIVHGDHGEAFGEHDSIGHHEYLYEENIHVPLLFSDDLPVDPQQPISLTELPELVLSSIREGDENDTHTSEYAFSQTANGEKVAVRGRDWKYIQNSSSSELVSIEDGHDKPLVNSELSTVGEKLVRIHRQTLREKEAIRNADFR